MRSQPKIVPGIGRPLDATPEEWCVWRAIHIHHNLNNPRQAFETAMRAPIELDIEECSFAIFWLKEWLDDFELPEDVITTARRKSALMIASGPDPWLAAWHGLLAALDDANGRPDSPFPDLPPDIEWPNARRTN